MPAFNDDISRRVSENPDYFRELVTNEYTQVALMTLEPGSDVGEEVHEVDQVLVVLEGTGEAVLNRQHSPVQANSLVVVPAGTRHNLINTGSIPLKAFTLFSPPEVEPGTLLRSREETIETDEGR